MDISIEKLNANNDSTWKEDVKVVLMEKAQLADCDKPIKDSYHAFQLIRYLPPDYAGIVQAIYRWKDEDFKADKVLSELLAEEARLKQSNKNQEVLACQAKINSSRPLNVNARKIPSENHDQVELTGKVKGRQRKNQKRRPRSFSRKRQNTSLVIEANASVTTSLPPGTWIFDTAATSHFSCDKDSMLNYRPVKGAEVSVAIGGVTCPMEGTGEVELEFYKNDDYSRKVDVYPVKDKRDAFKCFHSDQNRVERYVNSKIISTRTDNSLEFCNSEFEVLLEEQGIKVERTNTYTPQQNGVSEWYNYTAMDCVKAMLDDSGLGNHFWVEALFCFTYAWNRICHGKQKLTPFELFCGNKPSVKHLKIFGAAAFLGVPKQQRRKLDMRAKKGIMVGYAQRTKGYRIWLPSDRKIIESINVNFDKDVGDCSGAVLDPPKTVSLKFDNPASNTDSDQESNKSYSDSDDSSVKCEFKMKTTSGTSKSGESQSVSPVKFSLVRTAVPQKKSSRTDIYYYVSGSKTRLCSHEDVRTFCESNNLLYDGKLFDFSGKNTCTDEIKLEPTEVNISQTVFKDLYSIKQQRFRPIIVWYYIVFRDICAWGKSGYTKWGKTGPDSFDDSSAEDDKNTSDLDCLDFNDVFSNFINAEDGSTAETVLTWSTKAAVAWRKNTTALHMNSLTNILKMSYKIKMSATFALKI
ncbi:Retrovirus-related Pol polyprotein from transposon TNT 1-94 [Araneus ventricosus]|uniref:Retrovirus-related Pol polyprotein from transposon TNT 1-94 n=1 Tax=Araneus ventricosus TaxID=182803 RepID=A0A4Y2RPF2_ARAVE|nr:Retrovirus-related Pol polyprotein from transposon TNT 1-94 [Araneus ventricosus]